MTDVRAGILGSLVKAQACNVPTHVGTELDPQFDGAAKDLVRVGDDIGAEALYRQVAQSFATFQSFTTNFRPALTSFSLYRRSCPRRDAAPQ